MYRHWKAQGLILQEGASPLTQRPNYGMYTPLKSLDRHQWMARRNREMEMQLQWRDIEMAQRAGEMEFILYGREEKPLVQGVSQLQ